jgi:NAD(P)-dependent dehydrogenase (short-subunit alcohol dehydrogenase family)
MGAREVTKDGFEKTFQMNHLAAFLLTRLLMPILIPSRAKVLQTSSIAAQRYGHVDIDDLQNEKSYTPQKAYGDGKCENILFTRELHRRFHDQGISAAAFHPGVVATNFASDTEPLIWLAEGTPGRTWQSGGYYEKNKPAKTNAQADDTRLAQQLWDRSAAMLNLEV